MPRTLSGTGGTFREHEIEQTVDPWFGGHSARTGSSLGPSATRLARGLSYSISLSTPGGQSLIICGRSKLGDGSVCGG